MRRVAMLALALVVAVTVQAQESDEADHPLLPRYAGADIAGYRARALDDVVVPTGPIAAANDTRNRRIVSGQVTRIDYLIGPAISPARIERHYTDRLSAARFETVFACTGPACGRDMNALLLAADEVTAAGLTDEAVGNRFLVRVARRGDTWVLLHIAEGRDHSQVFETVIEGAAAAG